MKPHRSAFEFCEVLDIKPTLIFKDSVNGSCCYKSYHYYFYLLISLVFSGKNKNYLLFLCSLSKTSLSGLLNSCQLTNDLHPDHFLDRLDPLLRLCFSLYVFLNAYLFVLTGYLCTLPLFCFLFTV